MSWEYYNEDFGESLELIDMKIPSGVDEPIELTFNAYMNELTSRFINPVYTFCLIKKVIFNDPATIVFWRDGSKTVVKCREGETFDKWTGLSMALAKRVYGCEFHHIFKKFCDEKGE